MLEVNSELFRYGVRAPTEECSLGILLISLQSIVGVVIQVASHRTEVEIKLRVKDMSICP